MGFPKDDYVKAVSELQATVLDRDAKGRNETNDFYSQFPHGASDLTFELYRRVQRILGAEKIGDMETVYGDALDLANYALFLMMMLKAKTSSASSPAPSPEISYARVQVATPPPYSTVQGQRNGCNMHPPAESHAQWCQAAEQPCTEDWYNPR
jgi:hypothetical protein